MTTIQPEIVEYPLACGDCGAPMRLRPSGRFRAPWYQCTQWPACRGSHGAHPDGKPLGIPANAETREARKRAHAAFDSFRREAGMSRKKSYKWLQQVMDMTSEQAHISKLDAFQCLEVELAVARARKEREPKPPTYPDPIQCGTFCEECGDCLHCYGEDNCGGVEGREHVWPERLQHG